MANEMTIEEFVKNRCQVIDEVYICWPLSEIYKERREEKKELRGLLSSANELYEIKAAINEKKAILTKTGVFSDWELKFHAGLLQWKKYLDTDGSDCYLSDVRAVFKTRLYYKIRQQSWLGLMNPKIFFFPSERFGFKEELEKEFNQYAEQYDQLRREYRTSLFTSAGLQKAYETIEEAIIALQSRGSEAAPAVSSLEVRRDEIVKEMYQRLKRAHEQYNIKGKLEYGDDYYFDEFLKKLADLNKGHSISTPLRKIKNVQLPGGLTKALAEQFLENIEQSRIEFNSREKRMIRDFVNDDRIAWSYSLPSFQHIVDKTELPKQKPWFRLWPTKDATLYELKEILAKEWEALNMKLSAYYAGDHLAIGETADILGTMRKALTLFIRERKPWFGRQGFKKAIHEMWNEINQIHYFIVQEAKKRKAESREHAKEKIDSREEYFDSSVIASTRVDRESCLLEREIDDINRAESQFLKQKQIEQGQQFLRKISSLMLSMKAEEVKKPNKFVLEKWRETVLKYYEILLQSGDKNLDLSRKCCQLLAEYEQLFFGSCELMPRLYKMHGLFSPSKDSQIDIERTAEKINEIVREIRPRYRRPFDFESLLHLLPKLKNGVSYAHINNKMLQWRDRFFECYSIEQHAVDYQEARCEAFAKLLHVLNGCGIPYPAEFKASMSAKP